MCAKLHLHRSVNDLLFLNAEMKPCVAFRWAHRVDNRIRRSGTSCMFAFFCRFSVEILSLLSSKHAVTVALDSDEDIRLHRCWQSRPLWKSNKESYRMRPFQKERNYGVIQPCLCLKKHVLMLSNKLVEQSFAERSATDRCLSLSRDKFFTWFRQKWLDLHRWFESKHCGAQALNENKACACNWWADIWLRKFEELRMLDSSNCSVYFW